MANSFYRTNPEIAKHFAKITFLSDNRKNLNMVNFSTLVIQYSEDLIPPLEVGLYVYENINNSRFKLINATGHGPNLSAPEVTIDSMEDFLKESS